MMKYVYGFAAIALVALLAVPAMAETERKGDVYPLNVCAVSGEELGSMGDPIIHIGEDGREVRFCCKGCVKKYTANPASFNEKVDAQILDQQAKSNPLSGECVKSGKALEDGGIAVVAGNRAMAVCCKKCKAAVEADPAAYISKVNDALIEAGKDSYPLTTCIVGGGDMEAEKQVDVVVAGAHFRLCCAKCADKVKADPVAYLSKLADASK